MCHASQARTSCLQVMKLLQGVRDGEQTTLWSCSWRELELTPERVEDAKLDLVHLVANSIKCVMTTPISARAHLDALYKWFVFIHTIGVRHCIISPGLQSQAFGTESVQHRR